LGTQIRTGDRSGSGGVVLDRLIAGISTKWSSGSPASICICGVRSIMRARSSRILVQRRRDKRAAVKLMRKLLRKQGFAPQKVTTDKLRSYGAAFRLLGLSCHHEQGLRQNNRAENSHQVVRRREALRVLVIEDDALIADHVMASKDSWGAAFCCGTSSVTRRRALEDCGGFPTDSVTEDFLLTLRLDHHGWRTVYLNEPLSVGLSPEGMKEYITQRGRWCLGLMQILRSPLEPLSRGRLSLSLRLGLTRSFAGSPA
jgi:hypothetical protein